MSGNSAEGAFNLEISFRYTFNLITPKGNIRAGSVVPLDWYYTDPENNESRVDSSQFNVSAEWEGVFTSKSCSGTSDGTGDGNDALDAGSSDFRYSNSQKAWQYSWSTPEKTGSYMLTLAPPGDEISRICITLR